MIYAEIIGNVVTDLIVADSPANLPNKIGATYVVSQVDSDPELKKIAAINATYDPSNGQFSLPYTVCEPPEDFACPV